MIMNKTFLFNPYTGTARDARDVMSDPQGLLIHDQHANTLTPAAQNSADMATPITLAAFELPATSLFSDTSTNNDNDNDNDITTLNQKIDAACGYWSRYTEVFTTQHRGNNTMTLMCPRRRPGVVAFDLDGTLALHDATSSWPQIGAPLEPMRARLHEYLAQGFEVIIFTARGGEPLEVSRIREWTWLHFYWHPRVTNIKGYDMIRFYDDRAKHIVPNTGRTLDEHTRRQSTHRHATEQYYPKDI